MHFMDEDIIIGSPFGSVREQERHLPYWVQTGVSAGTPDVYRLRVPPNKRSHVPKRRGWSWTAPCQYFTSASPSSRWFSLITLCLLSLLIFLALHVRHVVQKAGRANRLQEYARHLDSVVASVDGLEVHIEKTGSKAKIMQDFMIAVKAKENSWTGTAKKFKRKMK